MKIDTTNDCTYIAEVFFIIFTKFFLKQIQTHFCKQTPRGRIRASQPSKTYLRDKKHPPGVHCTAQNHQEQKGSGEQEVSSPTHCTVEVRGDAIGFPSWKTGTQKTDSHGTADSDAGQRDKYDTSHVVWDYFFPPCLDLGPRDVTTQWLLRTLYRVDIERIDVILLQKIILVRIGRG